MFFETTGHFMRIRSYADQGLLKTYSCSPKNLDVFLAFDPFNRECLKFCVCPKFITYVALRRGGSLVERSGTSEGVSQILCLP